MHGIMCCVASAFWLLSLTIMFSRTICVGAYVYMHFKIHVEITASRHYLSLNIYIFTYFKHFPSIIKSSKNSTDLQIPASREAKTGESQAQGQPGEWNESLSQNKKQGLMRQITG